MEEPASRIHPPSSASRRSILSIALGTVTTLFSASVLYPLFQFLWPPGAKNGGGESIGFPVEDLLVGQSRIVSLKGGPVLVIREKNEVVALSAVCTHLGCLVKYKGGGSSIAPATRPPST